MVFEMDDEERAARICGCIDAVADLLGGQYPGAVVDAGALCHLMRLIGEETRRLLEVKEGAARRLGAND